MVNTMFSSVKFWDTLDAEQRKKIEGMARKQFVRRRQVLFQPGDPSDTAYIMRSGLIRVVRAMQRGRELTVGMLEPGDLFGDSGMMDPAPRAHYSEAILDSEALALPAEKLMSYVASNPMMLKRFADETWRRRRDFELRMEDLVFRDVPARLARILIWLSEKYSEQCDGAETLITLKLTHQELASLVGTTRETTTLVLNRFKRQNVLLLQGRRLIITDHEALAGIAATMLRK